MWKKMIIMMNILFCSAILLSNPSVPASGNVVGKEPESLKNHYFRIIVLDEQTERGVPLVTLTTTNNISFTTDSNGIAAIYEPGLMNQKVFFHIYTAISRL